MAGRQDSLSTSSQSARAEAPPLGTLVDAPVLKSLMDDFYAITRIPMSLIDSQGALIVGAGWQDACTTFHRVNPESCANCIESDTVLTADIAPGETRLYRCKNGMWDAATPVMVRDSRVGNLFTGQFFFDDESIDLDFFREQARRYGFDEAAYLAAIEAAPRLGRETVETGLRFLANLSGLISRLSYATLERARAEAAAGEALEEQRALAQELAIERGILEAVMQNTDTQLAYLDREFNFVAVNDAYERGCGYRREELLGRNHFSLFPDAENEAAFCHARDRREPVQYLEKPFLFINQPWRSTTFWDWRLSPVLDHNGEVGGVALSARDVTRRVRQRAFNDAINHLNDRMHAKLDLGQILEQVTPEITAAVGCEVACVALRKPDGTWGLAEAHGLAPESTRVRFSDRALPQVAEAVAAGSPLLVTVEAPGHGSGMLGRLGLTTALVAPLSVVDGVSGALVLGYVSGPGEFDEFVVDFAAKVASSLSLAISNARMFHQAMHSSLLSTALAKINEVLLSTLTTEDVVARLVGEVSEAAGADKSLVIKVEGDRYTVTHVREVPGSLVGETRSASFYPAFALAATERRPVLIGDTWRDPRTNKEFVVPNDLRAFQLLPLVTMGAVTHVLALAYDAPRAFDEEDLDAAMRMASAMSAALNNARLYENERRIADRLQEALLAMPERVDGITFAYAYHSASDVSRVGGDFYDLFALGDGRVGITIGDVAGKGLNAAALTSLAKNGIRAHASEPGKSPSRVLELANSLVYRSTPAESFVTLLFGVLNSWTGEFTYANAGHPAAAVIRSEDPPTRLAPTGPLLGAFEAAQFAENSVSLALGDVLLLYTDGVTETRRAGELYGEERLFSLLAATSRADLTAMIEDVIGDIMSFGGGQLSDDLALLAVKRAE